ncbi:hypothetical protein IW249_001586 [Micromonospora vinacea]|uniref:Taurine catabolism dioxygenase TauD, TfdA family n=1 Tax=Micromonospora vinacea TaxID=709878 RepID=A0ABS0JZF8_9ACTN|nr:TauD/TfdA family dioxygenase [Micromonospora vinacea]MBG6101172.1 hypothetical protein [Micromonospora vinacea]
MSGGKDRFLSAAFSYSGGWRYDPGCMAACDERARLTVDFLREALNDAYRHEWSGDQQLLLIDNRVALHGRAAVEKGDEHRLLQRVAFYTGEGK